ncbi:MAG: DUF58 domain-containing protein [Planctomycetes bacterium]|nr:DUF58 domain-containing protein [Planctomycetota bacterium]MBI3848029.1 DUF58 domain-containing protein [Planctomycetota bacterium]
MIPREILKQVRRIQIVTSHLVDNALGGEYESVFKGRGMEFDEVREYQPGDDVRAIDWNVTARMGHPFIKKFTEERELTVVVLADESASQRFGSVEKMKREVAAELTAVLAFSAIRNKDRVGAMLFTDRIETFIPPKKGPHHVLRLVREVLASRPKGHGTNLALALDTLNRVQRRRAVVFILSDFLVEPESYRRALRIASRAHDVIAVVLRDPREADLPAVGFLDLTDAETGVRVLVDTRDPAIRAEFYTRAAERDAELEQVLRSCGVDVVSVNVDRPYVEPLVGFFRMRGKRR